MMRQDHRRMERASAEEPVVELLSANLCRCTGYRSIVAAAKQAAAELRSART